LKSIKFSKENVENVLNPPQKPTAIKRYTADGFSFSGIILIMIPSKKLLKRFDRNVDQLIAPELIYKENKYLARDPSPPPTNTAKSFTLSFV
jgi:hypothetical protein